MDSIQAVERWAQAVAFTRTDRCREVIDGLLKTDISRGSEEQQLAMLRYHMSHSTPYFVAAPICEMFAGVVGQAVPRYEIRKDDLPTEHGFCWFEHDPLPIDPYEPKARLRALSWGTQWVTAWKDGSVRFTIAPIDAGYSQRVVLVRRWYGVVGHEDLPACPQGAVIEPLDLPVVEERLNTLNVEHSPLTSLEQEVQDAVQSVRLFNALILFCNQRILEASGQPVERHARKRLFKAGLPVPEMVRVVQLRRRGSDQSTHDQHEAVDWSCQWVVRGHWRQQWFPSEKRNKPLWIMPHVKGPDDKPLKAPQATVFAVVR